MALKNGFMQKKCTVIALVALIIGSLAVVACPANAKHTNNTHTIETAEESAISAWPFAFTGFKL